jgi:ribosomal protein S18 acetylase RimI-like enzyme
MAAQQMQDIKKSGVQNEEAKTTVVIRKVLDVKDECFNQFVALYQQAFGAEPYNETPSTDDVREVWNEHFQKNSVVFVAERIGKQTDDSDALKKEANAALEKEANAALEKEAIPITASITKKELIGFSCGQPLTAYDALALHVTTHSVLPDSETKDIFYISELAVKKEARGTGLGTSLTKLVIGAGRALQFDAVCTITASEGSHSVGIFQKLGLPSHNVLFNVSKDVLSKSRQRLVCAARYNTLK